MSTNEVDENGNSLLLVAYENGHLDLLESLINSYGLYHIINQFNKRKDNLLLRAIKDQNQYLVQFLLKNNDIDLETKDEVTLNINSFTIIDWKNITNVLCRVWRL
jgi:ankyrin repeat protein